MTPLTALWQPWAVGWTIVAGEAFAAVLALAPGSGTGHDRWIYFGLASLAIQWIILPTLGVLYLLRGVLADRPPYFAALAALATMLATTLVVGSLAWDVFQESWEVGGDVPWSFLARLCGIALIVCGFAYVALDNHWRARRMAVRAKQAELEALQARMRPHFLFNALNTGIALVHARPEQAEHVLLDLSDLFRAALSGPRQIPLAEELDLTRRYLEIERLRFGDRLQLDWRVPDPLPDVTVPALSIQPLAENAIRHGIEHLPGGGTVAVEVEESGGMLHVTVRNPVPGDDVASDGHGMGLGGARAGVEVLTSGRGTLETRREGGVFTAALKVPAGA
jgi:two-component system sensor histidine kinase AlgZ